MLEIGFTEFDDWLKCEEEMNKEENFKKMIASFLYWLTVSSKEWPHKEEQVIRKMMGCFLQDTHGRLRVVPRDLKLNRGVQAKRYTSGIH